MRACFWGFFSSSLSLENMHAESRDGIRGKVRFVAKMIFFFFSVAMDLIANGQNFNKHNECMLEA